MNVLFIICDDLNDWVLHPKDHPQVKTPHIDRLRKRSVSFSNAHAAVPVCGPARKCLFSGLYPQTIDSFDFSPWNSVHALRNCVPLPLHFRNHGFGVFGAGKLLHEGAGGDFFTEYGYGVDYGPHPWLGEGPAEFTPHPRQYDLWEGFLPKWGMHHDMNYGPLSDVPDWKAGRIKGKPGAFGWHYRDGTPFRYIDDANRDRMPDEISVDYACKVMQRNHEKPFFVGVGLVKPHTPLFVPAEYFERFPIEQVDLPPYLENDLDDCAGILRNHFTWGFEKFDGLIAAEGTAGWHALVQAYLAAIAFVDDQVGRLVEVLEQEGHSDNTVIIFTSDNGYHLGEKNCIQKWHLWSESTRLPMMIHAPGKLGNGKDCHHPVSHIDLYPTLIDLCDLPSQPHRESKYSLAGHSLSPFLDDPVNGIWEGPPVALIGIRGEFGRWDQPPHFSVCSHRYRYTLCANGEEEMYDLDDDPHEWTNLALNAAHLDTKRQLRQELISLLNKSKMPDHDEPGQI